MRCHHFKTQSPRVQGNDCSYNNDNITIFVPRKGDFRKGSQESGKYVASVVDFQTHREARLWQDFERAEQMHACLGTGVSQARRDKAFSEWLAAYSDLP